jgi:hypothetical protein
MKAKKGKMRMPPTDGSIKLSKYALWCLKHPNGLIGKIKIPQWKETKDIFNHIDEFGFSVDYFKKEHILMLGKLVPIPDHKDRGRRGSHKTAGL